jgi:hypothetical protein
VKETGEFRATSVKCDGCGAPVEVSLGQVQVTCAFCKRLLHIVGDMGGQRTRLANELASLAAERRDLAVMSAYQQQAAFGYFGLPVPPAPPPGAMGHVVDVCPSCGAGNRHTIDSVLTRCAQCGAAMVASAHAVAHQADAAHAEVRRLRQEKLATERRAWMVMRGYPSVDLGRYWPVMYAPFGFMMLIGACGSVVDNPGHGAGAFLKVFFTFALCFGVFALGAGAVAWVVYRRRRFDKAAAALVTSVQGERLGGVVGVATWLDRYFAGPFTLTWPSSPNLFAWCMVDGFPALIYADPTSSQTWRRRQLRVAIAATGPAFIGEGAMAGRALDASAFPPHFRVVAQEGGLVAMADDDFVSKMYGAPAGLDELPPLLLAMAKAAKSLGGVPAS